MAGQSSESSYTVPKLNQDPVWSLKPWPAVVRVAGRDFEVPAMPAADWLAVLMRPELDLDDFIDEIIPDGDELVYEMGTPLEDLYEACLDLIAMVSARKWWVALRLIAVARDNWDVLGAELTYRHVDASQISLSAWLDVLLIITLRSMEATDVTMFTMRLEMPPTPELEEKEAKELEMDRNAFLALAH